MNNINTYGITIGDWIHYDSKLCSIACSLGYANQHSPLDNRINELVMSFFNQWQFVILTYDKLWKMMASLNEHSDKVEGINLSEYDIASAHGEKEFRSYAYLLIVNMKTYLDLFTCIVDIILNQKIREERDLPSFTGFTYNYKRWQVIPEIKKEYDNLKDKPQYPWIELLTDVRDRIIHRGYQLKPIFSFKKSEELMIKLHQGNDFYVNIIDIEIGKLFNDFITGMPHIEVKISQILLKHKALAEPLPVEASFQYTDSLNQYNFKVTET